MPLSRSKAQERKKIAADLLPILQEFRPQVIHCHSRGAARHLVPLARRLRIPVLTTLHGRPHFSLSKLLSPGSFGDHVSVICENLFQELRKKYRFPSSRLHLIRNPISFSSSTPELPPPEPVPGFYVRRTEVQRLGWVGRASGPKGNRFQELVRHLFPGLLQKYPELQLQVRCSNLSGSALETDLGKLGKLFPGRVEIQESSSDLKAWYRNQTWVLGGGRVAMEALAEGCPVLVLGEHSFLGPLTRQNWEQALASNFGDIGIKGAREQSLDLDSIALAFTEVLKPSFIELASAELKLLRNLLQQEFDAEHVFHEFERITRLCFWERLVRSWIPCLMYHKVTQQDLESPHKIWITHERFEEHLKFFKEHGFTSLWFSDLLAFEKGTRPLQDFPSKPLLITFDDGYRNNLELAQGLLQKYQTKANLFLLADSQIPRNSWDLNEIDESNELMSASERKCLDRQIFEIGSHGFRHRSLPELSHAEALEELQNSKQKLAEEFGVPPVAFAYPFGHIDENSWKLARASGYAFAVNTDRGALKTFENPWSIFRVNIFPRDGKWALWKKTLPWYRLYFKWKKSR